jgi:hypothetical protein
MPFHDTSGRKNQVIVNVDRVHQSSLDRFARTLDCDAAFQRHTKRNAGRNRRPRLSARGDGSFLCQRRHGD